MESSRRRRRYDRDTYTEFSRLVIIIGIGVLCVFGIWGLCAMIYMSASDNRPWPFRTKAPVETVRQQFSGETEAQETAAPAVQTVAQKTSAPVSDEQSALQAKDREYLNGNAVWNAAQVKSEKYRRLMADLLSKDSSRLPADDCGITQRDWVAFVKDNGNVSEKGLGNAYKAAVGNGTFDVKRFWETAAKYRDPKNPRKR